jgi:hypothetical protein
MQRRRGQQAHVAAAVGRDEVGRVAAKRLQQLRAQLRRAGRGVQRAGQT